MNLGERIKKVRRSLDLTQREFGERISIKQNSVAQIEMGRNTSDQTIVSICREFNVNETWLRTGEGEPFKKTPDSIAGRLAVEFGLDEFLQSVVSEYLKLNAEQRKTVRDFVSSIASEIPSAAAPAFAAAPAWTLEEEARAEAEEYYRQILAEKERAARSQVLPDGTGGDTPKMA